MQSNNRNDTVQVCLGRELCPKFRNPSGTSGAWNFRNGIMSSNRGITTKNNQPTKTRVTQQFEYWKQTHTHTQQYACVQHGGTTQNQPKKQTFQISIEYISRFYRVPQGMDWENLMRTVRTVDHHFRIHRLKWKLHFMVNRRLLINGEWSWWIYNRCIIERNRNRMAQWRNDVHVLGTPTWPASQIQYDGRSSSK